MPCIKCSTNKWKIGNGKCVYSSLEECQKAQKAMNYEKSESHKKNHKDSKSDKNHKK